MRTDTLQRPSLGVLGAWHAQHASNRMYYTSLWSPYEISTHQLPPLTSPGDFALPQPTSSPLCTFCGISCSPSPWMPPLSFYLHPHSDPLSLLSLSSPSPLSLLPSPYPVPVPSPPSFSKYSGCFSQSPGLLFYTREYGGVWNPSLTVKVSALAVPSTLVPSQASGYHTPVITQAPGPAHLDGESR